MPTPTGDAAAYVLQNVGWPPAPTTDATGALLQNVGILLAPSDDGAGYVVTEATADTPSPVIFALIPTAGRAGDGVSVIGSGFGASQPTYVGKVEAQQDDGTWVEVAVLAWARVDASANAGTSAQRIEPALGVFDPEHYVVDVSVPGWATPPQLPLRVRTNA